MLLDLALETPDIPANKSSKNKKATSSSCYCEEQLIMKEPNKSYAAVVIILNDV